MNRFRRAGYEETPPFSCVLVIGAAKCRLTSGAAYLIVSPMLVRLANALLIVALLMATGAHWAVLQSVAWTTMLAHNLRSGSLAEAVEHTFDGRHPCCLCKQIAAGKDSEKKTEFPLQLSRLEFLDARPRFFFVAPDGFWQVAVTTRTVKSISLSPPTPPPRGLFA